MRFALSVAAILVVSAATRANSPAPPQFPQIDKVLKRVDQARELQVTEREEIAIGAAISERVRARYGVVQDVAVHRYVALVGSVLVARSTRPALPYTFVVLDTDGVNAFAAPGGFVHVTRGALGLMESEAELAGVLAHEIAHVTGKHTIDAITKGKLVQLGANETLTGNKAVFSAFVDKGTELVLAGFGRKEELEADRVGVVAANAAGYAPTGLDLFLKRLAERNAASAGKQGLFASHPEMKERLDLLDKQVKEKKLTAELVLAERFTASIPFEATPLSEVATVEAGTAGLAGSSGKTDTKAAGGATPTDTSQKKTGAFGLSGMVKPGGSEKKSAEVTASAGSRGVDTERGAKGGPDPALVVVKLSPADVDAFKKEGGLR